MTSRFRTRREQRNKGGNDAGADLPPRRPPSTMCIAKGSSMMSATCSWRKAANCGGGGALFVWGLGRLAVLDRSSGKESKEGLMVYG